MSELDRIKGNTYGPAVARDVNWLIAELDKVKAVVTASFALNPEHDECDLIGRELIPMDKNVRRTVIEILQVAEAVKG